MNVRYLTPLNNLAQTLKHKLEEAEKQLQQAEAYLEGVEAKIPPEVLTQWKREHQEWLLKVTNVKNHKTLDNPFVAAKGDGNVKMTIVGGRLLIITPNFEALSKAAASEALKASASKPERTYGMELVGAIEGMVDLERER